MLEKLISLDITTKYCHITIQKRRVTEGEVTKIDESTDGSVGTLFRNTKENICRNRLKLFSGEEIMGEAKELEHKRLLNFL